MKEKVNSRPSPYTPRIPTFMSSLGAKLWAIVQFRPFPFIASVMMRDMSNRFPDAGRLAIGLRLEAICLTAREVGVASLGWARDGSRWVNPWDVQETSEEKTRPKETRHSLSLSWVNQLFSSDPNIFTPSSPDTQDAEYDSRAAFLHVLIRLLRLTKPPIRATTIFYEAINFDHPFQESELREFIELKPFSET